jgi:YidC/Oxa1 family membrane protein insertase
VDRTAPGAEQAPAAGTTEKAAAERFVEVVTDTFRMKLDTRGGTIVETYLQKYPVSVDKPEVKYRLLSEDPDDFFIVQSGLLSSVKEEAPTHQARFKAERQHYEMPAGAEHLNVDLVWTSPAGVKVTKRYVFTRGSHLVKLQHIVSNESKAPWQGREYHQLQRGEPKKKGNRFMYTYTGGVIWDPEDKYQKYKFDELAAGELNKDVTGGWIAMIQHYFLGAVIPPKTAPRHFYGKGLANGHYVIGEYSKAETVAPGETRTFDAGIYLGPKDQDTLAKIAEGLDLVVDYGWLTILAKPIYHILAWIHKWVGNWGWTIIIFTILIKAVFFKLSETSYRSMARMRNLTPRIQALKDRYGDDKQRLQQAMMEIYKKEKINPLGGCLPMLIQMPFFIALYWVLMESVELRQAPWIFWIKDLSVKDPYYVLPIIMGITMFAQQKLNPAPPDPMQEKLMMALPFVFTFMFAFFPSGLVLYWTMNNILSIAQQWVITRRIEAEAKKL